MMRYVVSLFLMVIAGCGNTGDTETALTLSREELPDQETWNPTIVLTREGRKRAVVRSGHLAKYEDRREVILDEKVDTDFYSVDEEHMSNVKSDRALVFEASDNLLAIGNVVVVSDSGVTLYTDSLFWDHKKGQIATQDTIMLTTESMDTLYGIGFESNVDLTHWKIHKPWGVADR
ncbi:MAG: LPS export ABC transporter periplasmic protein LptC [Candidatus Neomarinimicrobiota bacterium]